jgi:hypothetical protein
VKPIVERNMNEKMWDYKISQTKKNVLANDKNKVTSWKTMAAKSYSPTIVMRLDDNGNPTNAYLLTKNYWNETYNLVVNIVTLRNWKKQLSHKTFYVNDAVWRRKFYTDKNNWVDIRAARKRAKRQYWDRFNS